MLIPSNPRRIHQYFLLPSLHGIPFQIQYKRISHIPHPIDHGWIGLSQTQKVIIHWIQILVDFPTTFDVVHSTNLVESFGCQEVGSLFMCTGKATGLACIWWAGDASLVALCLQGTTSTGSLDWKKVKRQSGIRFALIMTLAHIQTSILLFHSTQ